jgi:hypothetical protein
MDDVDKFFDKSNNNVVGVSGTNSKSRSRERKTRETVRVTIIINK